tara:strand:+ start:79800 stop:80609 length:810 start_codon:yes stop_codon:yes gene_type:complete
MQENEQESIKKLIKIVSELRDPEIGCPWDLEQTHSSLIPFVIEEAYEVADAIREHNKNNLLEELGDLLLQVILHAQIATENNHFCFDDVVKEITNKLIRRHPHVFEKKEKIDKKEVSKIWEEIKLSEQKYSLSKSPISDRLRVKTRSQSPIKGAIHISKKAADAGFEWKTINEVWNKYDEEVKELKEALKSKDKINAEKELGDVLFTLINIARWYKLDPDEGLAKTNTTFLNRFAFIESQLEGDINHQSISNLRKLWEKAKKYLAKTLT